MRIIIEVPDNRIEEARHQISMNGVWLKAAEALGFKITVEE